MSITIDRKGKQIADQGERIYFKIKPEIEKKYDSNYFVTIEVKSGKYFIGKTPIEAFHKARKVFPEKQFFLAQVGRLAGRLMTL